jgi:hypothetical protein
MRCQEIYYMVRSKEVVSENDLFYMCIDFKPRVTQGTRLKMISM